MINAFVWNAYTPPFSTGTGTLHFDRQSAHLLSLTFSFSLSLYFLSVYLSLPITYLYRIYYSPNFLFSIIGHFFIKYIQQTQFHIFPITQWTRTFESDTFLAQLELGTLRKQDRSRGRREVWFLHGQLRHLKLATNFISYFFYVCCVIFVILYIHNTLIME